MTSTNARGMTANLGTTPDQNVLSYDGAGNMTSDGENLYLYDAEGRVCAVGAMTMPGQQQPSITGYIYDGDGVRVAKGTIPSTSVAGFFALGCDPSGWTGFQFTADYVLGPGGEQLTQFDGQGKWQRTNVYAAGKLVGTYDLVSNPQYTAGGTAPAQIPWLHFHFTDALGTRRMQVSGMIANLGQPEMDFQSLPFGDQLATLTDPYAAQTSASTPIGATPLFFTGKERDAESGNDYFGARYFASSMGRMLSPDLLVGSIDNPQSLNRYAYSLNNPLRYIDPTGLSACDGSSGDGEESSCSASQQSEQMAEEGWGAATKKVKVDHAPNDPNYSVTVHADACSMKDPSCRMWYEMLMRYLQRRAIQYQIANQSLWSMSPEQRIKQIALAQPTICGGGAFAYGGRSLDVGPANGFAGWIVEADSNSGISKGALFEAGGGEGVVGGGGYIVSSDGGGLGSSGFAYGGAGVELPGAHASVGEVAFSSGIGVYGDVSAGGRDVGGGVYLNVTTNAGCRAAHK